MTRAAFVNRAPVQLDRVPHGLRQRRQVEAPVGPVAGLPDIGAIPATHAEIMITILRIGQPFAAINAVKRPAILRKHKV